MRNVRKKLDWFDRYNTKTRQAHALTLGEMFSLLDESRGCVPADKIYAVMNDSYEFGFAAGYHRAMKEAKKQNAT